MLEIIRSAGALDCGGNRRRFLLLFRLTYQRGRAARLFAAQRHIFQLVFQRSNLLAHRFFCA